MSVSSYQFCSSMVITVLAFANLADPTYAQRDSPQDRLKKLLTNVKEVITSKHSGLILRVEGQKGFLGFEGYDPAKVVEGIDLGKSQLLESLNTKELSGLKGYVAKYYPLDRGLKVVLSPQTGRLFASTESTNAAYKRVEEFIGKLQSVTDRLAVNLTITSEPDEAQFEVYAEVGNSRSGTSRAEFTNLYRGLYSYKVVKEGYKPITGELNLVDEVGTLLDCKLFPLNGKDGPYPCNLKRQP